METYDFPLPHDFADLSAEPRLDLSRLKLPTPFLANSVADAVDVVGHDCCALPKREPILTLLEKAQATFENGFKVIESRLDQLPGACAMEMRRREPQGLASAVEPLHYQISPSSGNSPLPLTPRTARRNERKSTLSTHTANARRKSPDDNRFDSRPWPPSEATKPDEESTSPPYCSEGEQSEKLMDGALPTVKTIPPCAAGFTDTNVTDNSNSDMQRSKRIEFCLLPEWCEAYDGEFTSASLRKSSQPSKSAANQSSSSSFSDQLEIDTYILHGKSGVQKFIFRPDSIYKLAWVLVGLVCIIFDLLTTPLVFLSPTFAQFGFVYSVAVVVYWTCDILLNFMTGFHNGSDIEMRPRRIARAYIHSWLTLDLAIVILDWLSILADGVVTNSTSVLRFAKSFRLARMLRLFRLLRLRKIQVITSQLEDRMNNQSLIGLVQVIKMLTVLLVVAHYLACFWYGIGKERGGWVHTLHYGEKSLLYLYLTALHWSLSQFQGTMEVSPTETYERAFAVCVLLIGLVGVSVVLSSITTLAGDFHQYESDRRQQWWALRKFMREQDLPTTTCLRIKKHLEQHEKCMKKMPRSRVKLLDVLPETLQMEVDVGIYSGSLKVHAFFRVVSLESYATMKEVCHRAVRTLLYGQNDTVFHLGEKSSRMFFVTVGILDYTAHQMTQHVHKSEWVSEASLWLRWDHVGDCVAAASSTALTVATDAFITATKKHASMEEIAIGYSRRFLDAINDLSEEDTTDLLRNGFDHDQVINPWMWKVDSDTDGCRKSSFLRFDGRTMFMSDHTRQLKRILFGIRRPSNITQPAK